MTEETFLIVGGEGKTGRHVADGLRERGKAVRIGSRSAPTPFDWRDPAGWPDTLAGVRAAYVAYQPDLAVPGAAEDMRIFSHLAAEAGVERLVLLSGRGEDAAEASEAAMKEAGVAWTVLRASWFFQNFSEGFFADPVRAGELVVPADRVREPFIDARDIAGVAVAALTEEGHAGKTYDLTGPRLMTFREAVATFAGAAGRDVVYEAGDLDAYADAVRAEGATDEIVDLIVYLFGSLLDGRNEYVSDGVQQVLGRPPRDFADFARETAESGFWRS